MDQIKIDNFIRENPGREFPYNTRADDIECANIRRVLSKKLHLDSKDDRLLLVNKVDELADIIDNLSSCDKDFNLEKVLTSLKINCQDDVYINWYRYDDIDIMRLIGLVKHFDDVWYPDKDDVDIFDGSLSWVLSINHHGQVKLLRLNN